MSRIASLTRAAALACFLPTMAFGQVPSDLQATMRTRDSAIANIDPATWARLTADGFTVVQADGSMMTKAERLAQFKGQQPSTPTLQEHLQINHYQDVYVRRFLSGGSWVMDVWIKDARGWSVVAVQVTTAKK
jgi:hypothetical protein